MARKKDALNEIREYLEVTFPHQKEANDPTSMEQLTRLLQDIYLSRFTLSPLTPEIVFQDELYLQYLFRLISDAGLSKHVLQLQTVAEHKHYEAVLAKEARNLTKAKKLARESSGTLTRVKEYEKTSAELAEVLQLILRIGL